MEHKVQLARTETSISKWKEREGRKMHCTAHRMVGMDSLVKGRARWFVWAKHKHDSVWITCHTAV